MVDSFPVLFRFGFTAGRPSRREAAQFAGLPIDEAEFDGGEADDPVAGLGLGHADGLAGERLADIDELAAPFDLAAGADAADGMVSPEKAKAAWEVEAKGVAGRLGLDAEKTKALAKAYSDARESHTAAQTKMFDEMRGGGGDRTEMRQKMEDMNKAEREKFEKALGATVNADQKTKVMGSLGTFNQQWDRVADAIVGFNLEPKKHQDVLNAVEDWVVAQGKARANMAGGDREAAQTAMQESRKKLVDTVKPLLTEDQLGKFEAAMGRGGRGGPGGPGGNPPRRNRDGGGGGGGGGR